MRCHGAPPPHRPQLDNAALSGYTQHTRMSWRRRGVAIHEHPHTYARTRGNERVSLLLIPLAARLLHARTGMNVTNSNVAQIVCATTAKMPRFRATARPMGAQTVMPLEARISPSNTRSYRTRQTIRARSARDTRTRLRNVWSTPGAGKGTPAKKD